MKKIIILFFIYSGSVFSQVEFFPGRLNVQPFTANFLEPRLGFQFHINNNELRLNISNSLDIIRARTTGNETFSLGADLFTYTLLRGESNFHFPVDAVDYLFGLNAGYKNESSASLSFGARFRLSHISAHFADGHLDPANNSWRDGISPKVYSREFIELIPFISWNDLRFYTGYTYTFHVDPGIFNKNIFQFGFDYFIKNFPAKNFSPFVGYDLRLFKINTYTGNNSFMLGLKFGYANGKGISLFYNYYSGNSIHGEYFFRKDDYNALGLNLDL